MCVTWFASAVRWSDSTIAIATVMTTNAVGEAMTVASTTIRSIFFEVAEDFFKASRVTCSLSTFHEPLHLL